MDLGSQESIKRLADENGPHGLMVLLGAPDAESAEIAAETVALGDPSWAGALAGVQLGLEVYHVLEDEVRSRVPGEVWEEQIGVMADVIDSAAVSEAVRGIRARVGQG